MDRDPELDAILRSADDRLLRAIENNLDLDAGFDQLTRELPEVAPVDGLRSAAGAESRRAGLPPVRTVRTPAAASGLPVLTWAGGGGTAIYDRTRLIMIGLVMLLALNIGILIGLTHNSAARSEPAAARIMLLPNRLPDGPDVGPSFPPSRPQPTIILGKPGSFAPLGNIAARAGIGGNPVISYLGNSSRGPLIQISGIPAGTRVIYFGVTTRQPCPKCAGDANAALPFPRGGDHLSYAAKIFLTGADGRIVLRTEQAQPGGQISVLVTWLPDLA